MNSRITDKPGQELLSQEYDLGVGKSKETHYYQVQTEVVIRSSGGVLKSTDHFRQLLKVEPSGGADGKADKFTCANFYWQRDKNPEVSIPSLKGFSYELNKDLLDKNGVDEQGNLYGVPEEKFEGLIDHTGAKLSFDLCYQVHSAFFYYHGYIDYAEPTREGNGVQNLKKIGDKIVHDGAFAELPVPGKMAKKESIWKNGEITLEFKGLGVIDARPCAILGVDSGMCSLVMPMTIMPLMNLKTIGFSNYRADIYLDLESNWVRKLEMILSEITITSMWGVPVNKSVPVSKLTIKSISTIEFDQG